jgi:hypothetical protein
VRHVLDGANTTAQWYADDFTGALFSHLEKGLLHSTETRSWPGYSGGASAPNATYHPRLREIRQHFPNNRSARALRDPSDTVVRENRDFVWQLEIVAYSDKALARSVGGLWIGDLTASHYDDLARMFIQLHEDYGLPLQSTVKWREGYGSYYSGVRLAGPQYDAYRGILAHIHASGNTHWDVDGFYYSRLKAAIVRRLKPVPVPPPSTPLPTMEDEMQLFKLGATRFRMLSGDRYVGVPSDLGELWVSQGVKALGITAEYDAFLAGTMKAEGL